MEELNLVISDVNEEGGVAIHQPDAFLVYLAIRGPYCRSCPNPDDASIRVVCCTWQYIAVDVSSQLVRQLQKWTSSLARDVRLISLGLFFGLVEVQGI